ncbi:hypothetical protein [Jidongwangia harbinensis]|uniref:hypothetical protein n=1 Tax=Jidongwangia harbinensis TaxID=2878561 RepID=UPI001CD9A06C|nr:hypothetical protein [Jidongwangia harbinensis]MCA2217775.1 hypothetical protein [Jidongwangia harbinensis]
MQDQAHPETWWAQFPPSSDRFDPAYLVDGLGDLIIRKVSAPLLRQEVKIATDVVVRGLNRPGNAELAGLASAAATRLATTLERMAERSTGSISTVEAAAMSHALHGRYARAATEAESFVGTQPLLRVFLAALRLERFDIPLALRLLEADRAPEEAVRSGLLIGRYSWWPSWLLHIVTERALAGTLDEETIAALDRCAYADLSPFQARLARRLLSGEAGLLATAAERLEGLGEREAADRLRDGDLNAVALAARLVPR